MGDTTPHVVWMKLPSGLWKIVSLWWGRSSEEDEELVRRVSQETEGR